MAHLGHYHAAIELFTEAIKLDPKDFRYVYLMMSLRLTFYTVGLS